MLKRGVSLPARGTARMLGISIGIILVGWYLDSLQIQQTRLPAIGTYLWQVPICALLLGAVALAFLAGRGLRPLQRGTLVLIIGIFVLYSLLVLWPAYTSGLAWFPGDPKGSEEFEHYHVWYLRANTPDTTMLEIAIVALVLMTVLADWFILLPLGILLLSIAHRRRLEVQAREQQINVAVGVLAIVVPLVTWTASHQFWRWFID
jgi:hypothetical protein